MKKFIVGFICGALIFSSIGVFANSNIERITAKFNPDLPIYLNGEKLPLENGAINYQDTNYLSIRETAEILGLEVNWNYEAQAVELSQAPNKKHQSVGITESSFQGLKAIEKGNKTYFHLTSLPLKDKTINLSFNASNEGEKLVIIEFNGEEIIIDSNNNDNFVLYDNNYYVNIIFYPLDLE